MSDLISRSALIEAMTEVYKKHYAGTGKSEDFTIAMEMVRKQPTAYDVEKVVAELSEKSGAVRNMFGGSTRAIGLRTAIDIVKAGGAE